MAWTLPHSWATGQTISGSTAVADSSVSLNYQLRDNLLSARNLWDNAIHLSLTSNPSVPSSTPTSVVWRRVDWQVGNSTIWASASGARLQVPVAGRWEGLGVLEWTQNVSGGRSVQISVNGTTSYRCGAQAAPINSGDGVRQPFGDILELTTADHVQVLAFQNTGGALELHGGKRDRTRFCWRFLGAAS